MKSQLFKTSSLLVLIAAGNFSFSQDQVNQEYQNENGQKVTEYKATSFEKTKTLLELTLEKEVAKTNNEIKTHVNRIRHNDIVNQSALPLNGDPIQQTEMGTMAAKNPIVNFDGLPMSSGIPLDPSGAAGPNHYVQAINSEIRIWDKNGTPLVNASGLSSLWTGSTDDGDPIVLYDKYADRWFISQFQSSPPYKLLVAVSQTNDPTGSYYAYSYTLNDLPDYPKYSIWNDGYYFSINSQDATSGVMDRTKMLVGDGSATMQIITAPGYATNGFTSLLPTDADGDLPANGSPCYFFNLVDDAWGVESDGIKVYKMTTDFNNAANTAIVEETKVTTSAFDSSFPNGVDPNPYQHISQKGTSFKVDAVTEVLYYRAQHRVWTNHNSVVLCHVVDVDGNDRAGIRWYELRQVNGIGNWTLYQEGTYAPNSDTDNRWMASISMDNAGNIGLAYSASGPDTYPSVRFTGRSANAPLGQMNVSEFTAVSGLGSQENGEAGDRFGDYSHLSLDPNGTTFWHTAQYVKADGYPATRIYSFDINQITAIDENMYSAIEVAITNDKSNLVINGHGLPNNEKISVDIFNLNGQLLMHKDVQPNGQSFNSSFNVNGLNSSMYLVRLGNESFQKVLKHNLIK